MNLFKVFTGFVILGAVSTSQSATLPVARGPFEPSWESLKAYECPEWFRDAKFGIWVYWGPQSVPEMGDNYAHQMYVKGSEQNRYHVKTYGQPSEFGFKDLCNEWKANAFEPKKLVRLYRAAGAKYVVVTANGRDNFDNWNSRSQPWNAAAMGPKKDLISLWEDAVRTAGLRFGLSVHAAQAWKVYEPAAEADASLTRADGKGKWWQGYDPNALYAQKHNGTAPDAAYCKKFFYRTIDLISTFRPDFLCFDDEVLPLKEVDEEYGLSLAAHLYNSSITWNSGDNQSVLCARKLDSAQRECFTLLTERDIPDGVAAQPWQLIASIGDSWYYNRFVGKKRGYKTVAEVVHMLIDAVSRNGNLLLNIPLRADGTIDEAEVAVLEKLSAWMKKCGECVFNTRPWKIHGEGEKIRFTTKGDNLYIISFNWPQNRVLKVRTLAKGAPGIKGDVTEIRPVGGWGKLAFKRESDALKITLPQEKPCEYAFVFKVKGIDLAGSFPVEPQVQILAGESTSEKKIMKTTSSKKGTSTKRGGKRKPSRKGRQHSGGKKKKSGKKNGKGKSKSRKAVSKSPYPKTAPRNWKVIDVDSVDTDKYGHLVFDGDPETRWHTDWHRKKPKHPHFIAIDLGKTYKLTGFTQLPRYDNLNGVIKDYEFYASMTRSKWKKVVSGQMKPDTLNIVRFKEPVWARYIKLVALSEYGEKQTYTSIAELDILTADGKR